MDQMIKFASPMELALDGGGCHRFVVNEKLQ